jgi:prepilin-type N-terminal cleavage/methylation domain-containing protein
MSNQKAFTIVEMLTAVLILGIIIVGLFSIFKYQSNVGADSWIKKGARDTVSRAMRMIADDLRHAGYGLTEKDEDNFDPITLSVYATGTVKRFPDDMWVDNSVTPPRMIPKSGGRGYYNLNKSGLKTLVDFDFDKDTAEDLYYTDLYISYGRYLGIGSYESGVPVIYKNQAYVKGEEQPGTDVALGQNIVFDEDSAGNYYKGYVIGAFIGRSSASYLAQAPVTVDYCWNDSNRTPKEARCRLTGGGFTGGYRYAPAIRYSLVNDTLYRNFGSGTTPASDGSKPIQVPLVGKEVVATNANRSFIVKDFLVRFDFYNSFTPGVPLRQPGSDSDTGLNLTTSGNTDARNLRMIEVVIVYEVRDPNRTAKQGTIIARSEIIAPRSIVYTAAY